MMHAVIAAGAAHRREYEKKTAHHLAEAERGDGEINAFEPQGREADHDAGDACRQRRDHNRCQSTATASLTVRNEER